MLEATRACVAAEPEAAKWDWQEEEKTIWQSALNFVSKDPDRLGVLVPDYMREAFDVRLQVAKSQALFFRKDVGWHIRGYAPTLVAGTDVLIARRRWHYRRSTGTQTAAGTFRASAICAFRCRSAGTALMAI